VLGVTAASVSGCAAVSWLTPLLATVSNLSEAACSRSFSAAVASSLEQQGETPEEATVAASRALRLLPLSAEPYHFEAASNSGVTYEFLFQPRKSNRCVLRLYERQKNGATVSNTFTYFATRDLSDCSCDWILDYSKTTYYD
jgi:hypothetical protein